MTSIKVILGLAIVPWLVLADKSHSSHRGRSSRFGFNRNFNNGFGRSGRQFDESANEIQGAGIDFSGCEQQPDGMCCIIKQSFVKTLRKDPILECIHKNVEKCHYTYVTIFEPSQEEICEENFEKKCQITFRQVATRETIKKCLTPLIKKCDQQQTQPTYGAPSQPSYGGPPPQSNAVEEECRTIYESACTTKYVEKSPGKFVGDTSCEKLPIRLCGQGCSVTQGPEECHNKDIDTLIDVPEEVCDLNPQKTCRFGTKLVPKLKPKHECTIIPREVCSLKFSQPKEEQKPLTTKWCIDPNEVVESGETYEEESAVAPVASYLPGPVDEPPPALPSYEQSASIPQYSSVPVPVSYDTAPVSNSYNAAPISNSYDASLDTYSSPAVYNGPTAPAQNPYSIPNLI